MNWRTLSILATVALVPVASLGQTLSPYAPPTITPVMPVAPLSLSWETPPAPTYILPGYPPPRTDGEVTPRPPIVVCVPMGTITVCQ